mgnify:CR=1 FL=1
MSAPAGPLDRVGHGRWAIVPIGILWVTDAGVIGFQPPPKGNAKDIETLIDEIATVLGAAAAKSGDVATWTVDRRPVFE